jgi:hypothetical protein
MPSKIEIEIGRRVRVRQMYEAFPHNDRSENGVLKFYCWLQDHYTHLLPTARRGDVYLDLIGDLKGLYQ